MQALVGKLNFAAPFIPNYKKLVRPIEALLSRKGTAKWTSKCTDALNQLVAHIFQRLALRIADVSLPFTVYIGVEADQASVVITQAGDDEQESPVVITGRPLLDSEVKLPEVS